MTGVRTGAFGGGAAPEPPVPNGTGVVAMAFLQAGGLQADPEGGSPSGLQPGTVLLWTGGLRLLPDPQEGASGLWAAADRVPPPDGSGPELDAERLRARLRERGGWAVLAPSAWSDALFQALDRLDGAERDRYCAHKAAELLYLLDRGVLALSGRGSGRYFDQHQRSAVGRVYDYMAAHLDEPMTIDRLSRQFRISSTLLKECFRSCYGQPLHSCLRELRMRRAAELLSGTSLPVAHVAAAVGYGSVSQFGAAFRRAYRRSPAAYRREKGG